MRRYLVVLTALLAAIVLAPAALAFVVSRASNNVIQQQPAAGSCAMRGKYPFNRSDLRCTPGALNPAVTQKTVGKTICRSRYTDTIRPPSSITKPEKLASMAAYGLHRSPGNYEYDHLISLQLGGATNDARNLWPEPGRVPNLKDKVESALHHEVCDGRMSLARAQDIIALDWVSYYKSVIVKPKPKPKPKPSPPPDEGVVHPGAFCSTAGATGHTTAGTPMVCNGPPPLRWRAQ